MFHKIYPKIWPFAFAIGGVASLMSGDLSQGAAVAGHGAGHGGAAGGLFAIFGVPVGLHDLMWFLMAAAHLDAFWGRH